MHIETRISKPGDECQLKALWQTVFGDSDEYLENFFCCMYSPGMAIVAEADGKIVSCAFLLDLGDLVDGHGTETGPCSVLYALATYPEYRGRGLGSAVVNGILKLSEKLDFSAAVICPAEPSLFDYYGKNFGYETYFTVSEKTVLRPDAISAKKTELRKINSREYGILREKYLSGRTHIKFNPRTLSYQQSLCTASGGDMYTFIKDGSPIACCASEIYEDTMYIKELLFETDHSEDLFVSEIFSVFSAVNKIVLRTPELSGTSGRNFAMISAESKKPCKADLLPPWFGFAFD